MGQVHPSKKIWMDRPSADAHIFRMLFNLNQVLVSSYLQLQTSEWVGDLNGKKLDQLWALDMVVSEVVSDATQVTTRVWREGFAVTMGQW